MPERPTVPDLEPVNDLGTWRAMLGAAVAGGVLWGGFFWAWCSITGTGE